MRVENVERPDCKLTGTEIAEVLWDVVKLHYLAINQKIILYVRKNNAHKNNKVYYIITETKQERF